MELGLRDKAVLITGSSKGIGKNADPSRLKSCLVMSPHGPSLPFAARRMATAFEGRPDILRTSRNHAIDPYGTCEPATPL